MKKAKVLSVVTSICYVFLLLLAVFTVVNAPISVFGENNNGIGEVSYSFKREIYSGVELEYLESKNTSGEQKLYTVSFNPKTTKIKPIAYFGDYMIGGESLNRAVKDLEAQGKRVIFGVNADAYDMSNGVALGAMISQGRVITTTLGAMGVGYKSDGTVVYGDASLKINANVGGRNVPIGFVNKDRKADTAGVYLYTNDYSDITRSTSAGIEVELSKVSKDYTLEVGKELSLIVSNVTEVSANQYFNNTVIEKEKLILAVNKANQNYEFFKNLGAGTEVVINVETNKNVDWEGVVASHGMFQTLKKDNAVYSGYFSDKAIHPRTVMGVKPDGTVVYMEVDGRQPGFSRGLSYEEIVKYMESLNCHSIFNFDGGGSSTIYVRKAGESYPSLLNSPSDSGRERSNANAILFVAEEEETKPKEEKLHIYADFHNKLSNSVSILKGSSVNLEVLATDNELNYADISGKKIDFSVEGNIGFISENGMFTASEAGSGKVKATLGELSAEINVKVVDSVDALYGKSTLNVNCNGKTTIPLMGRKDGVPTVVSSVTSIVFGNIGNVNGLEFAAGESAGIGSVKMSAGGASFETNIAVTPLENEGLKISTSGATKGAKAEIKATNNGKAEICDIFAVVGGKEELLGATNERGVLVTEHFADLAVGTEVYLFAKFGEIKSETLSFKVAASLAGLTPTNLFAVSVENGIQVTFDTSIDIASAEVLYSLEKDFSNPVNINASGEITPIVSLKGSHYNLFSAILTNLQPNKTYYYKAVANGKESEIKSFNTRKNNGAVAFYGNINGRYTDFNLATRFADSLKQNIDLNVISGNIFSSETYEEQSKMIATLNDARTIAPFNDRLASGNNVVVENKNIFFLKDSSKKSLDEMSEFFKDAKFKIVVLKTADLEEKTHEKFKELNIDLVVSANNAIYGRDVKEGVNYVYLPSSCSVTSPVSFNEYDVSYSEGYPVITVLTEEDGKFTLKAYAIKAKELKEIDEISFANEEQISGGCSSCSASLEFFLFPIAALILGALIFAVKRPLKNKK